MGLESACTLVQGKGRDAGWAHLDAKELLFRGESRRVFSLAGAHATAEGPRLFLTASAETITLELESARSAKLWAEKINSPRTRLQKLGIKPETRLLALSLQDASAMAELGAALDSAPATKPKANAVYDVILLAVREVAKLDQLHKLVPLLVTGDELKPPGALWVLWPKGRKDLRHEEVVEAAKAVGLSQTKSAAFNDELTGLRLVRSKTAKATTAKTKARSTKKA